MFMAIVALYRAIAGMNIHTKFRAATACKSGMVTILAFILGLVLLVKAQNFDKKQFQKDLDSALMQGGIAPQMSDPKLWTLRVEAIIPDRFVDSPKDLAQVRLLKADFTWSDKVDEVDVAKTDNVRKGMIIWVQKEVNENGKAESVILDLAASKTLIENLERYQKILEKVHGYDSLLRQIDTVIEKNAGETVRPSEPPKKKE